MPLQLVVANPPRRKTRRKKAAKKGRRRTRRSPTVAKRTTRRRRRRTTTAAPRRRTRRRSSRGSFGGTPKTFAIDAAKAGIGATAGFIAAEMLPPKIPVSQLQTGYGLIAAKALVGVVGGLVLGKAIGRKHAAAFATGAMTNAGVSLYSQMRAGGVSGIGMASPLLLGTSEAEVIEEGIGDYAMEDPGVY